MYRGIFFVADCVAWALQVKMIVADSDAVIAVKITTQYANILNGLSL